MELRHSAAVRRFPSQTIFFGCRIPHTFFSNRLLQSGNTACFTWQQTFMRLIFLDQLQMVLVRSHLYYDNKIHTQRKKNCTYHFCNFVHYKINEERTYESSLRLRFVAIGISNDVRRTRSWTWNRNRKYLCNLRIKIKKSQFQNHKKNCRGSYFQRLQKI